MSDITRELCRRIVDVGANDISDAAFGHAATLFLDGLAVASAGADAERGPTILAEHIRSMGSHPHASLIGFDFRCSAPQAAYLNGTSMHVLDFEPMWSPATHALSTTLPVVLALGEQYDKTGREIATALIKGIEIQGWLRVASGQFEPQGLTFHPPGLVGPLGAAVAAAHLLELSPEALAHALGLATSRCGSVFANVGSMTKSTHCGLAASLGLDAALLAARGFTASDCIFDDPRGYGPSFSNSFDAEALLSFGAPFRVVEPSYAIKLFPSQYGTHFAIAAGIEAFNQIEHPDKITRAVLTVPAMQYVDRPKPKTGLDGKFSWQYTLANALLDGTVGLDTFTDETRFAARTESMLDKIEVVPDASIPARFEDAHVRLNIHLDGGRNVEVTSHGPRGKWGQPALRDGEHRSKLLDCLTRRLEPSTAEWLLASGSQLQTLSATEVAAIVTSLRAQA